MAFCCYRTAVVPGAVTKKTFSQAEAEIQKAIRLATLAEGPDWGLSQQYCVDYVWFLERVAAPVEGE